MAAINRANIIFERAVRTLTTDELMDAWADDALAEIIDWVESLRARDLFATPVLHAISLERLEVDFTVATAQTVEHWTFVERDRITGAVTFEHSGATRNVYELHRRDHWMVVRVTVTAAEP